jgi:uncharacterized C2H2 Zn-finger protein
MPKCSVCDREFKNDLAMKIHFGKQHRRKRRAKAGGKAGRRKGAFTCPTCGRKFKFAMHLARHAGAAHGKGVTARKAGRAAGRIGRPPTAAATLDVRSMAIEQLIELKHEVDARLRHIAKRLRRARVRA